MLLIKALLSNNVFSTQASQNYIFMLVLTAPKTHLWHTHTTHLLHLTKTGTMMTITELKSQSETSGWINIHYMCVVQCLEINHTNLSHRQIVENGRGQRGTLYL